jgi:hypothetical protein
MLSTVRHVLWAGALATSFCCGISTPSARAQALGSAQAPAYSYLAPQYYTAAPVYSYAAPSYYVPAPVYSYPSQTNSYQPQNYNYYQYPAYTYSDRGNSEPGRSYSYFDKDGVEHDNRYPHWTFDYNSWVQLSLH